MTPIWSPGSDRIYFGSGVTGDPVIYELEVGGASSPRVLCKGPAGSFIMPSSVTPDGRTMVAWVDFKDGRQDIIRVDTRSGESSDYLATPDGEAVPAIDPSGTWVAFSGVRTGEEHVYLTTLEPGGPVLQVSREPALDPRWSPDGRKIYYLHDGARRLSAVDVELGDPPILGTPRIVFEDFYWDTGTNSHYDVAPDGRILTFVDIGGSEVGREIRVQSTWLEESPRPGG